MHCFVGSNPTLVIFASRTCGVDSQSNFLSQVHLHLIHCRPAMHDLRT